MKPTIIMIEAPFFLKKMRNDIKKYLKKTNIKLLIQIN